MLPLRTRLTALFVLVLLGAPGVAGVLLTLHLAHHHDDNPRHAAADFDLPLHGHEHAEDTVEHSHPALVATRPLPGAPTTGTPPALAVAPRGPAWATPLRFVPLSSMPNGHGPPGPPGTRPILRI